MFQKVPTGFIPEIDQGVIFVNVELPEGASLERTEKVMNQVEDILKSTPGMAHTINRIGSSIITQATASNSGTVICIFEPFEERKKDPKKSLRGILVGNRAQVCRDPRGARPRLSASVRSGTGHHRRGEADDTGSRRRHAGKSLKRALQGPIEKGASRPELDSVFTLFRANTRRFMPISIASRPRAEVWTSARSRKRSNSIWVPSTSMI